MGDTAIAGPLTRRFALKRLTLFLSPSSVPTEGVSLLLPTMSSSIPVGALVGWMLLLTAKHIIADFFLQNSWMAIGKDQKKGWELPLLAHCLVHLAVALLLILIVGAEILVRRLHRLSHSHHRRSRQGLCTSTFGVNQEHPWFLVADTVAIRRCNHLTGFGLSIFMAAELSRCLRESESRINTLRRMRADVAFDDGPAQCFVKPRHPRPLRKDRRG